MDVGRRGMKRDGRAGTEGTFNFDYSAKSSFESRRKWALPWHYSCVFRFAPLPVYAL